MTTKRHKNIKNKTIKKSYLKPSIKILKSGYSIYAAKSFDGEAILKYTMEQEKKSKDSCLYTNISWFGDLKQAKIYHTSDTKIYKWLIKKPTNLLIMNKNNKLFFKNCFQNFKGELNTSINLTSEQIITAKNLLKDESIDLSYLNMKKNERAYFEFAFAYGYITLEQQYQFMKLMKFLIENDIIDIKKRDGSSIINKLKLKINYYYFFNKFNKQEKYNRLSLYSFDKDALTNLCKIVPKQYKIDGVFQPDAKSFWFPDLKVYKMDIKEYVLYNPHHNLIYDGIEEE